MNTLKKTWGLILLTLLLAPIKAHAEDSLKTQLKDAAADIRTIAKKGARRTRKAVRTAVGKGSDAKDAKDRAKDAADDAWTSAKKRANKAKEND